MRDAVLEICVLVLPSVKLARPDWLMVSAVSQWLFIIYVSPARGKQKWPLAFLVAEPVCGMVHVCVSSVLACVALPVAA